VCLEHNGEPEMARILTEKADQFDAEIAKIKAWGQSLGASL
jgi:hypothetical protein